MICNQKQQFKKTKSKMMQHKSEDLQNKGWPLFDYKAGCKIKRFWEKHKKEVDSGMSIIISGMLQRIGKKHQTPKVYFFLLDNKRNLYYFKNEKKLIPKGKVALNEYIQINLKEIVVKEKELIAIEIIKSPKVTYKIFSVQGQSIFDWWKALTQICTINNYDEQYLVLEELGKGSFATVFKVRRLMDQKIFAAKYYYQETYMTNPSKEKFFDMIKNEITILRQVSHPCIIKVHEVYQQSDKVLSHLSHQQIAIIMDYVPGKDLYGLIKRSKQISERKSAFFIQSLSEAMLTLNNLNYVHRDLKLENILIEDLKTLQLKIVDFGFAERINPNQLSNKSGTPGYIAPEVFYNQPYTEKGDVFSLGIILFSMISGYSPFRGRTYEKIMEENKNAFILFDRPVWKSISEECMELIRKMTSVDSKNRISFEQILEHPWIQKQTQNISTPGSILKSAEKHSDIFKSFDFKTDGAPKSFYQNFTIKSEAKAQQVGSINKSNPSEKNPINIIKSNSNIELDEELFNINDKVDSLNIKFLSRTLNVFHVNKLKNK